MNCPKCSSDTLASFEVEDQEFSVEKCSECGGMWFDEGELEKTLGELAESNFKIPDDSEVSSMPCPRCQENLHSFNYPKTYAKVEMCRACKGFWLDENDFEEISMVRKHSQNNQQTEETPQNTGFKSRVLDLINGTIEKLKF